MATTNLNIRIDKTIKDQAEEIHIPFELKPEVPNDTTAAAIEEGRKLMNGPSAPRYSSMDALKATLDV